MEKVAAFFVSVPYLKFVSTKYYEKYTQSLLPENSDQVKVWVASLLQFQSGVSLELNMQAGRIICVFWTHSPIMFYLFDFYFVFDKLIKFDLQSKFQFEHKLSCSIFTLFF